MRALASVRVPVLQVGHGRADFRLSARVSGRIRLRTVWGCLALIAASLLLALVGLCLGERVYTPAEVIATLTGNGSRTDELFVNAWRLPRVTSAIVFGALLGASGAIFQTVTRNPLGSPDIIGFTAGAYTGGILTILVIGSGYYLIAGGAVLGGLLTAAIIFGLARRGGLQGYRLIIVGIAANAMLLSLDTWMLLTAELDLALVAAVWGMGTLGGVAWEFAGPALVLGLVLLVACALIARPLAQLELGDDQAAALGVRPESTRTIAIVLGVALVAVCVSITGPIAFVALAAPQIGRRVVGSAGTPIFPAACTGGLLLVAADVAGQNAIPDLVLPAGLVTVAIGGAYLLALVVLEDRRGTL